MNYNSCYPAIPKHLVLRTLRKFSLLTDLSWTMDDSCFCTIIEDSRSLNLVALTENQCILYVPSVGHKFNGYENLSGILNNKNICLVLQKKLMPVTTELPDSYVLVSEWKKSLEVLVSAYFEFSKIRENKKIYAVTGTNGKTSVTEIIAQLEERTLNSKIARVGTLGFQIGEETTDLKYPTMPSFYELSRVITALNQASVDTLVMEATSQGLVESRLGSIQVDIALFTNFSPDHLDFHGSMEKYRLAKTSLFHKYLSKGGLAVVNTFDTNWQYFMECCLLIKPKLVGYGSQNERESFFNFTRIYTLNKDSFFLECGEVKIQSTGSTANLKLWKEMKLIEEVSIHCNLTGRFQFDNVLLSVSALAAQNFPLASLIKHCSNLSPIPGRLERAASSLMDLTKQPTIIIDYAHSPDGLNKALEACKKLLSKQGELWCVFGCGGDRDATKRPLMAKIAEENADRIVITSDNPRTENPLKIADEVLEGIKNKSVIDVILDRPSAIDETISKCSVNDIILIAGKGSESYQIVGTEKFPMCDKTMAIEAIERHFNTEKTI